MKLKKLFRDIAVTYHKGSKDVEITGITENSKVVAPGNLFIVINGSDEKSLDHIREAVNSGAIAILTDIPDPFLEIVQVIHPNPRSISGLVAEAYYDHPSEELFVVGVTGTNGKTTTSYLVKHLLDSQNIKCGLIGTIEYLIGQTRYQATHTTPDAITNQKLMREMIKHDCQAAVMEVSSHGLDQGRVSQIDFDVAIFTNLTQDHLDYHGNMEQYGQVKALLFEGLAKNKTAIVNADSPWHDRMLEKCAAKVITYAIDNQADIKASSIQLGPNGTTFEVSYEDQLVLFSWALIGRFNVYNCLAALGACLSRDISLEDLSRYMANFRPASGRLERVRNLKGLNIFVDYAHTDDALENVLKCLQEINTGRIITVFGCGGNRDRGKRPKMAAISERFSDVTIVTSDNPRNEDPEFICQEILKGFSKSNYIVDLDRRSAIERAIKLASRNDLILIAGKGHETYQIFSHKTIEFDDRKIAAELVNKL